MSTAVHRLHTPVRLNWSPMRSCGLEQAPSPFFWIAQYFYSTVPLYLRSPRIGFDRVFRLNRRLERTPQSALAQVPSHSLLQPYLSTSAWSCCPLLSPMCCSRLCLCAKPPVASVLNPTPVRMNFPSFVVCSSLSSRQVTRDALGSHLKEQHIAAARQQQATTDKASQLYKNGLYRCPRQRNTVGDMEPLLSLR